MYFLPENSKRRENVIAGLTAALVGVAMIAIAGKASATDPAATHDHTATTVAMEKDPEEAGEKGTAAPAVNDQAPHADHASHQAHHDGAAAHQADQLGGHSHDTDD